MALFEGQAQRSAVYVAERFCLRRLAKWLLSSLIGVSDHASENGRFRGHASQSRRIALGAKQACTYPARFCF